MERRRAPTLADRAQWPWRLPRQATMAREDAIRDMAALYGNAAQRARLTPEEAAWRVQERREWAHEQQWGITPWSTERRLGPGRPIRWDGPHTGEGGWLTVAQAEAMRAKDEAAQRAAAAAARRAAKSRSQEARTSRPAPVQYPPDTLQSGQRIFSPAFVAELVRRVVTPPPTCAQIWTRVTAYGGPLVLPSTPYCCGQCGHTTTVLAPIPPGIYAAACAVCGLQQHHAVA